jgi:hypothetical protein
MPSCGVLHNGSGHSISIGILSGAKRPGREADQSPISSAEVNNVWSYTLTPKRLHSVQTRNYHCASMMSKALEHSRLKPNISTCYLNNDREIWIGPSVTSCASIAIPPPGHNIQQLPFSVSVGHQPAIRSKQSQYVFRISNVSKLQTYITLKKMTEYAYCVRSRAKVIYTWFI